MFVAFLKRTPFVRLIIPLMAGIALQLPVNVSWGMGLVCSFLLFLYGKAGLRFKYLYGWISGLMLHLLIICVGSLLVHYSDIRHHADYFAPLLKRKDWLLVTVQEPLQEKANSYQTIVSVRAIVRGDSIIPARGAVLLYLQKDKVMPECGDELLVLNKLEKVTGSRNPGGFDHSGYFTSQQIYEQAYLQTGRWRVYKKYGGSVLFSARNYCLRTLNKYIGGQEAGLAAALLIGYRYDLDKSLKQDYTDTGIVHIIAISGMHLVLIYGSLLWLLKWLPKYKWVGVLLIIFILWAFTLLTGACASIMRACIMLTFFLTGKYILDRYANEYNILAGSAFLLLCYDPRLLTDVGFQLSYLSVLSLLVCFDPIYDLFDIPIHWLDRMWRIIASTLAAQVFTLPFCVYYFHRFPLYFLPANLLAVPLSTIVLYGEMLLLLIPCRFIGACLQWLMAFMNTCIAWIGHLRGAVIRDIYIPLYGTFCLYMILAGLAFWWLCGWRKGFIVALTGGLIWMGWDMVDRIRASGQHKLVVYNIRGCTAVDVINGRNVSYYGDTVLLSTRAHFKIGSGSRCSSRCMRVGDKRLMVIDSAFKVVVPRKKIHINYLLLSHNPHVDIRQLDAMFVTDVIIFDDSNSRKNIQQWKSDCYTLTLRFFSVPHQGAYVVNF